MQVVQQRKKVQRQQQQIMEKQQIEQQAHQQLKTQHQVKVAIIKIQKSRIDKLLKN